MGGQIAINKEQKSSSANLPFWSELKICYLENDSTVKLEKEKKQTKLKNNANITAVLNDDNNAFDIFNE